MPAPKKEKLPYFSHESNARQDRKQKLLIATSGVTGTGFYWWLLEDVYNDSYYLPVEEEDKILLADAMSCNRFPITVDDINFLLNETLKRGLFDEDIYEKYKILTSASIQRRYLKGCARRVKVDLIEEYRMIKLHEFYKEELENARLSVRVVDLKGNTLEIYGDYKEPHSNGQQQLEIEEEEEPEKDDEPEYDGKYDFDCTEKWDGQQPIDYAGCVDTWNKITGANSRITDPKREDLRRVFRNYVGRECMNAMIIRAKDENMKDNKYLTQWSTLFGAKKLENLDKWVERGREWLDRQSKLESVDDHLSDGWVSQKKYEKICKAAGIEFEDPTFCETKQVNGSLLYYPKFDY